MAETLHISSTATKEEKYTALLPQLEALTSVESDLVANLANITAALKSTFNFFWVGFYIVKGEQLVLAPFQGPIACTRIPFGKGVCGSVWEEKKTIIVEDVEKFEGHIACSSDSKSEIVLPAFDAKGNVMLVLDIDSDVIGDFDQTDQHHLEKLMRIVEGLLTNNA